jgi:asparagine synthase (glutamine-hydrolysing)
MKVIVENKHDDWRHLTVGDRIHHMKGRPYEGRRGLDDREIACRMNDAIDEGVGRICDELVRFRGSFAIIVETEREVICVTDPIRSIPIFYRSDGSKVSADANRLVSGTSHLDGRNTIEFMLAGFVTGDRTLYQDIRQMEYAEILAFPKDGGAPRGDRYFEYRYKASNESEERLMDDLGSAFEEAFERTAAELRRRHARAVVPLSGGLDSRIVLAMLRRMGVEDILCYTYGVRGNREARISRRVAREMDADWHFVRYTARKNYRAFNDPLYEEYRMFGSNLFSLAHSQEFLALKEMTEGGVLRDSDVIIPGHALDMLSGSHFPSFTLRGESDVEKGIDHIVGFHLRQRCHRHRMAQADDEGLHFRRGTAGRFDRDLRFPGEAVQVHHQPGQELRVLRP